MEVLNNEKAKALYTAIDELDFVEGCADREYRSKMNVTFRITDDALAKQFDDYCLEANIVNLKGHRSVGGYRASLYNAVSIESVNVLVDVLRQLKTKA